MLPTREGVRDRLRHPWTTTAKHARRFRGRVLGMILNRVTTWDDALATSLLLGDDIALGHGREGVLRDSPEFTVGTELGQTVRYGNPEEREGAVEALIMELCLFKLSPPYSAQLNGLRHERGELYSGPQGKASAAPPPAGRVAEHGPRPAAVPRAGRGGAGATRPLNMR